MEELRFSVEWLQYFFQKHLAHPFLTQYKMWRTGKTELRETRCVPIFLYLCMCQNRNINFDNSTQEDYRSYIVKTTNFWKGSIIMVYSRKKHKQCSWRERDTSIFAFSILNTGDLGKSPIRQQRKQYACKTPRQISWSRLPEGICIVLLMFLLTCQWK